MAATIQLADSDVTASYLALRMNPDRVPANLAPGTLVQVGGVDGSTLVLIEQRAVAFGLTELTLGQPADVPEAARVYSAPLEA